MGTAKSPHGVGVVLVDLGGLMRRPPIPPCIAGLAGSPAPLLFLGKSKSKSKSKSAELKQSTSSASGLLEAENKQRLSRA